MRQLAAGSKADDGQPAPPSRDESLRGLRHDRARLGWPLDESDGVRFIRLDVANHAYAWSMGKAAAVSADFLKQSGRSACEIITLATSAGTSF